MRLARLLLALLVLPAFAWGQAALVVNGNRVHAGWTNYGTTAGTTTAYTLTFAPVLPGYVPGQCFLVKPHLTNTGAATLNVQGKGAKPLRKLSGGSLVPVVAGDLPAGRLLQICYDGTTMQLLGSVPDAAGIVCDGVTMVAAAIQNILDTVPLGSRVELPPGSCMLDAPLTITRSLTLAGAGMDQTYLKQVAVNLPVLTVSVINVHVSGMTLMHNTSPVTGGDGLIVRAPNGESLQAVTLMDVSASWNWRGFVLGCMAYAQAVHVVAQKNNSHGFEFLYETDPGCGVDQWDVLHANATLNKGAGFYGQNTVYAFGLGPWLTQTVTFGNLLGGYVFQGSPGHPINDLRLHNLLSSSDNVHGIYLDTHGGSHLISQPWIEYTGALGGFPVGFDNTISVKSDTGHCLELTANNGATSITGGLYWNCSWSGVALNAPYATMTGGSSLGNGQALDAAPARRAGITIAGEGVLVNGHSFTFPGTTTLTYVHQTGAGTTAAIGLNTYGPGLPAPRTLVSQRQRGQVTIADTATTATVTFTPAEPDVLYFVQLTPVATTGGAPPGANTITGVTKDAGSFQVAVSAAPGVGRVVVYDWLVYR